MDAEGAKRWCILRSAGPRTLAVAAALRAAGFDAWTPTRTARRALSAGSGRSREVVSPIVPTFVFANASDLPALVFAAADPSSRLPAFSVFQHAGRVPLIGAAAMDGLRDAEAAAHEELERQREAEARKAAHDARVDAQRTKAAKRKLQRRQRRDFAPGTFVDVTEMPAFAGVTGEVVRSDGTSAVVSFGGSLIMKIEAWRLAPQELQG